MGTVGLPLPGTAIKTVDPETGADLPAGAEGSSRSRDLRSWRATSTGPPRRPRCIKEGWYLTGDLGYVDPEGFIKITDRLSRFSKIAGELVPHLGVESAILAATGVDENHLAVTGVPDPKHGERLCVLYTELGISPAEVCQRLNLGPLPKVWIPSSRDFIQVEQIPITPLGKINLQKLKEIALNQAAREEVSRR